LYFAHEQGQIVIQLIERIRAAVGKPKREFVIPKLAADIASRVSALVDSGIREACVIREKHARYTAYAGVKKKMVESLTAELGAEKYETLAKLIKEEFENRKADVVRNLVLD